MPLAARLQYVTINEIAPGPRPMSPMPGTHKIEPAPRVPAVHANVVNDHGSDIRTRPPDRIKTTNPRQKEATNSGTDTTPTAAP
jgi:hypothetical protein